MEWLQQNFGLVIVVAVVAVIGGGILAARAERKRARERAEALERAATYAGWRYVPEEPPGGAAAAGSLLVQNMRLVVQGNIVRGTCGGREFAAYDVNGTRGQGKQRRRIRVSVVEVRAPLPPFPDFAVSPETDAHKMVEKVAGWFSMFGLTGLPGDIDFPDDQDFSDAFWVVGPDAEAVRALLSPAVRRRLSERFPPERRDPRSQPFAFEPWIVGRGSGLAFPDPGLGDPEGLRERVERACALAGEIVEARGRETARA